MRRGEKKLQFPGFTVVFILCVHVHYTQCLTRVSCLK